jgi:hypothetical protein
MITHDPLWSDWFATRDALTYALDVVLIVGICAGGWWMQRRQRPAA